MKHPIALILTDTHLHKDNIELVKDIWYQAIEYCRLHGIKVLFFAGDFFTARVSQSLAVLIAAKEIKSLLKNAEEEFGLDYYMISGNHDKVDQSSENSYLDIIMPEKRLIKSFAFQRVGSWNFSLLPYFKEDIDYPKYFNTLNSRLSDDKNVLITHIAINGVKNNDGSSVESGIDPNLFNRFHKVFVGHYHDMSKIGNNIYYCGSAYQANYGENNLKGFTIFYDDGSHEMELSKFPEFKKINIDAKELKNVDFTQLKQDGQHIRFVIEGDKEQLESIDKAKYTDLGIDVKFNTKLAIQDISKEFKSFNRNNIVQSFDEFCALNSVEDKELGDKYLKTILN